MPIEEMLIRCDTDIFAQVSLGVMHCSVILIWFCFCSARRGYRVSVGKTQLHLSSNTGYVYWIYYYKYHSAMGDVVDIEYLEILSVFSSKLNSIHLTPIECTQF